MILDGSSRGICPWSNNHRFRGSKIGSKYTIQRSKGARSYSSGVWHVRLRDPNQSCSELINGRYR